MIREFEVFSNGVDVALTGTATQSETYKDQERFGPDHAIDGSESDFSHTDSEAGQVSCVNDSQVS